MEASDSSSEYEGAYLDLRSQVTDSGSWPPVAQNALPTFFDFGIIGDPDGTDYQLFDQLIKYISSEKEIHAHLPFTGSTHFETEHGHQQYSSEIQAGPQIVSKRKPVDETYTKYCGVYSPEKVSPVKSSNSSYHCPRCDEKFTQRRNVKLHFPRCILKHGNPDALKWNDHFSLQPLHQGGLRDRARTYSHHNNLKAYSGMTISSKLPQGQAIIKFKSPLKRGNFLCPVCGGGPFSIIWHVKSHFITCVRKNGNPTGANWYDGLDPKRIEKYSSGKPDVSANAPQSM